MSALPFLGAGRSDASDGLLRGSVCGSKCEWLWRAPRAMELKLDVRRFTNFSGKSLTMIGRQATRAAQATVVLASTWLATVIEAMLSASRAEAACQSR